MKTQDTVFRFWFGVSPGCSLAILLALWSGLTPSRVQGIIYGAGIEPSLAVSKASTLLALLFPYTKKALF